MDWALNLERIVLSLLRPMEDVLPLSVAPTMPFVAHDFGQTFSKSSEALRRIRADIVAGKLQPGQKLSFKFLVTCYDMGTSPLREALCQLAGQGMVELESQRGFRVAPVSRADLEDVIAMRAHAEIYAAGLSITRGNDAWRRNLGDASLAFTLVAAKAGDQWPIDERWEEIHRRFHFALIGACGSPTLLQFCKQIYHRYDRYRRIAIPVQAVMAGPAQDHREITQAALSGNSKQAQSLLRRHIDDMAGVVLERYHRGAWMPKY